jgi:salicylate hydroxylase
LAYRTLAVQRDLPVGLRSADVTVWLGPRMHVVAYPVQSGELLNVVAIVQGHSDGPPQDWDQAGAESELMTAIGPVCRPLQDLVRAMPSWRLWVLQDRRIRCVRTSPRARAWPSRTPPNWDAVSRP